MFDGLKNMAALPQMMARARELQGKMQHLQTELARREFSAEAGGGLVTATVNGKLELIKLRIDHDKLGRTDPQSGAIPIDKSSLSLIEDLITAAVRAAQTRAADEIREQMSRLTEGLDLPPGLLPGT